MAEWDCRYFNGYKPCGKNEVCDSSCPSRSQVQSRILLIHLGALGAVVRSTALLSAIRKKYPQAHITWVTQKPADQILRGHPLIDRVLTTDPHDLLVLSALEFDVAFSIDKSLAAAGVLKQTKSDLVFGFVADAKTGAIQPANPEAHELWALGISNQKKFFENRKPETQLVCEALQLEYDRCEYSLPLSEDEQTLRQQRRKSWGGNKPLILGINTGCSPVIPYKKWTVEYHREIIAELASWPVQIVLLGGPEDTVRNQRIAYGLNVVQSPTTLGLRDGLVSVSACDMILTGDSLGMHMAIAQKKWIVAWFGPTCDHEIDLFERGVAIKANVPCSPCWRRTCHKSPMCYDRVDTKQVLSALQKGIDWYRSSSIQHLSVTSSLPSLSCDF